MQNKSRKHMQERSDGSTSLKTSFGNGRKNYSTSISSTKTHAFPPAPSCHGGQAPIFVAVILIYLARMCCSTGSTSFTITFPLCSRGMDIAGRGRQSMPSFETENVTVDGRNIHEPWFWRNPTVTFFTGRDVPRSTVAITSFPSNPNQPFSNCPGDPRLPDENHCSVDPSPGEILNERSGSPLPSLRPVIGACPAPVSAR